MSLQIFFEPLSNNKIDHHGFNLQFCDFTDNFPQWENCKAAIFSVGDAFQGFRLKIRSLHQISKPVLLADLGVLRSGIDPQSTTERLIQVCSILLKANVLPIILLSDPQMIEGQFLAYTELKKIVNFLCIDKTIDTEKKYLKEILLNEHLFLFTHLGHQRFVTSGETLHKLSKLGYELKSLGKMRDDFKDIEACLRNADMVHFNLDALKGKSVFGLTAEEACQIGWYLGVSPRISSFSVALTEQNPAEVEILSALIWYLIDGLGHYQVGRNLTLSYFKKYIVTNTRIARNLIFYENEFTEQWWMELPADSSGKSPIVACSQSDYMLARSGELPERWLKGIEIYL